MGISSSSARRSVASLAGLYAGATCVLCSLIGPFIWDGVTDFDTRLLSKHESGQGLGDSDPSWFFVGPSGRHVPARTAAYAYGPRAALTSGIILLVWGELVHRLTGSLAYVGISLCLSVAVLAGPLNRELWGGYSPLLLLVPPVTGQFPMLFPPEMSVAAVLGLGSLSVLLMPRKVEVGLSEKSSGADEAPVRPPPGSGQDTERSR